ncbi:MAG: beta-N-acetylhexosaminidase [Clostridia bacterium]|nr:beta-N-acetylhexosaminidase [Clostridia bacterium]
MLHLIPSVKILNETEGFLQKPALRYDAAEFDPRLVTALKKLPFDNDGATVTIALTGTEGEGYTLDITPDEISITADSAAGAFYAIQTLRQIFANGTQIPCLHIEDQPDFPYRGFYHDITRGRVPSVETIKRLIDNLAYYKQNSFQLYVEHVFEFEETKDIVEKTGYLTKAEMDELDAYCKENFIEFIPSLNTFGHMHDILQQPKYHHLRVARDFQPTPYYWFDRMCNHTVNPLLDESFDLIKSLINQYESHFSSKYFNICCDETASLKRFKGDGEQDNGQMYLDFVQKIIGHVKSKNKTPMMWADILLEHPETIEQLPQDTLFLNWDYSPNPKEEKVSKFAELKRPQIVCPGTHSWARFCEIVEFGENNICNLIDLGRKYGAIGVLNTNWGDWGHPASIEMACYGMVLGAGKSWAADTKPCDEFYKAVDLLLYGKDGAFDLLRKLSKAHDLIQWFSFAKTYYEKIATGEYTKRTVPGNIPSEEDCKTAITACKELLSQLQEPWGNEEYRKEMALAVRGVWVMAELYAKALQ